MTIRLLEVQREDFIGRIGLVLTKHGNIDKRYKVAKPVVKEIDALKGKPFDELIALRNAGE